MVYIIIQNKYKDCLIKKKKFKEKEIKHNRGTEKRNDIKKILLVKGEEEKII